MQKRLQIKQEDLEIGDLLGQGKYATVFKAVWKGSDRIVAVKKVN
jgi:serine/threonine protein kinase